MMLSSSIEIELILGIFGVLLGALAIVRSFWRCDPEFLRKAMHVGMGLVAFLLPWLFVSNWSVVLLAGTIMLLLMTVRLAGPLRRKLGGVIHDVRRDSWGEIYFALGVVGLFMLSHNEPLYYGISILILVLADTAASLIGCRHGFRRYHVLGECKSLEGSLAFLMTAFLIGALGLSLFGSVGIMVSLVVALAFALPATLVEAVAGKGTDNFLVPFATFVLIKFLLTLSQLELPAFLAIMVVSVPVVFLFICDRSHSAPARRFESPLAKEGRPRRLGFSPGPPAGGFLRLCGLDSPAWHLGNSNASKINN
jgi:phytol kinase